MAAFPGWEKALLRQLGAPATGENLRFLAAWQRSEGGSARFNPLNTTQHAPGAGSYNSVGVRSYGSAQQGLQATAHTLLDPRYQQIVGGLRSGRASAAQLAHSLGRSPWGTDAGLVLRVLGSGGSSGGAQALPAASPSLQASAGSSAEPARRLLAQQLIANLGALRSHQTPDYTSTWNLVSALRGAGEQPSAVPGGVPTFQPPPGRAQRVNTSAKGVVNFEGKPVAAWIAPILRRARAAGWKGSVSSGYRSVAEQRRIYNSGVRPAARPGQSNHNFTGFPGGAIDVTDAAQLASILRKLGISALRWAGSKDPVHFSHPHNGSY